MARADETRNPKFLEVLEAQDDHPLGDAPGSFDRRRKRVRLLDALAEVEPRPDRLVIEADRLVNS